ncbi:cytochrome-c oxidase, cbb3-type subunit II [Magnetovibrio blakemorei]|uniref:Cytochrome-c oxidase, cbb3-type subunit II n=2 Tax=Magnetovibrio blakemorei TaxID=28181 RepID=A0A1E5Q887_9PROT|nr:cytochrome-c oxidase, cbb3-type subunit II [Magnetovibrio blakemorei]
MDIMQAMLEKNVILLGIATLITISIGALVQLVPLYTMETTIEKVDGMRPYSPLELAGRNIYIREGCYLCHSQMIRPFRDEVERYGHYSLAAESMYDHPFQWGSKRTGPDLARVGGKYSNTWHVAHLINPRAVVPESVMPGYPFLATRPLSADKIAGDMKTLSVVGVPYTDDQIENAQADLKAQANPEMGDADAMAARYPKATMGDFDGNPAVITEMDALVSYLQLMGTLVDTTSYQTSPDGR